MIGSLFIAGILGAVGIYVLTHVTKLAEALQNIYVLAANQKRKSASWSSSLYIYDPNYWRRPFAWFLFKGGVITFGLTLIISAVPIGFGVSYNEIYDKYFAIEDQPEMHSLEEYDAFIDDLCSDAQQSYKHQLDSGIATCADDEDCIQKVKNEVAIGATDEFQRSCIYTRILNDLMEQGSLRKYAREELYAIYSNRAKGLSDAELKTEILSGGEELKKHYDTEFAMKVGGYAYEFIAKRVINDAEVEALGDALNQKYGQCWNGPDETCDK